MNTSDDEKINNIHEKDFGDQANNNEDHNDKLQKLQLYTNQQARVTLRGTSSFIGNLT